MKSTFIIVLFLLNLPQNALFRKGFQGLINVCFCWHLGKIRQDEACYYYLLVVKLVVKPKSLLLRNFLIHQNIHHFENSQSIINEKTLLFLRIGCPFSNCFLSGMSKTMHFLSVACDYII